MWMITLRMITLTCSSWSSCCALACSAVLANVLRLCALLLGRCRFLQPAVHAQPIAISGRTEPGWPTRMEECSLLSISRLQHWNAAKMLMYDTTWINQWYISQVWLFQILPWHIARVPTPTTSRSYVYIPCSYVSHILMSTTHQWYSLLYPMFLFIQPTTQWYSLLPKT